MSNPPCVITLATSSRTTITTIITTATTVAAVAATTTKTRTTSNTNHQYPPVTRILCVYGRVILYWFDGVCVQLYDLRKKRLKMVNYTPANGRVTDELFDRPGRGQRWPYNNDDVDITTKLIYCRRDNIDYKLHIYVENCLPLKTFMPKGCTILQDYDKWLSENKDIADVLGAPNFPSPSFGSLTRLEAFCWFIVQIAESSKSSRVLNQEDSSSSSSKVRAKGL
ncbi:hypothetical protein MKW98_004983 [Papaver atlanticum]|uniref:Uncharacterized protein n=1 Tax=Papaver atlanticum TaxID=357466 RepID=A0AAD4TG03_9MAGN|nr:hypothetical protein MKW98_004983 [Papaver atlanticum]